MGENTKIGWVRNSDGSQGCTLNPWVGCTKVGPGCDHCYAEKAYASKMLKVKWGVGEPRHRTASSNWDKPKRWNKDAEKRGIRIRVFCASLADVFDNEVPPQWRHVLFKLIRDTPNLDWIILTKRIGNVAKMLPADWGDGYPNVWLVATVVNQEEVERDVPKLLGVPAAIHGLSIEPQLGPVTLWPHTNGIDWVICGAESGAEQRHFYMSWPRDLRDECGATDIAFFLKQIPGDGRKGVIELPLLDGRTHEEMPA